jgi:hypothetical protein
MFSGQIKKCHIYKIKSSMLLFHRLCIFIHSLPRCSDKCLFSLLQEDNFVRAIGIWKQTVLKGKITRIEKVKNSLRVATHFDSNMLFATNTQDIMSGMWFISLGPLTLFDVYNNILKDVT